MILEWLLIGVLVLAGVNLILFAVIGFLLFKQLTPILDQEQIKPSFLKIKQSEWIGLMEESLTNAYHAHPDSKPGLLQVRKELRKQKEEN